MTPQEQARAERVVDEARKVVEWVDDESGAFARVLRDMTNPLRLALDELNTWRAVAAEQGSS